MDSKRRTLHYRHKTVALSVSQTFAVGGSCSTCIQKDGTRGCTIEAHNFQRDLSKYEPHHAVISGVSVDSTDSHKEFCAKEGLTFRLLADSDKKVVQQYGSSRNLVVFRVAARNPFLVGPGGNIAKIWTGVDPGRHSAEVLAALAELQSKK